MSPLNPGATTIDGVKCKCGHLGFHIHLMSAGTFSIFFDDLEQRGGFGTMKEAREALASERGTPVGAT